MRTLTKCSFPGCDSKCAKEQHNTWLITVCWCEQAVKEDSVLTLGAQGASHTYNNVVRDSNQE